MLSFLYQTLSQAFGWWTMKPNSAISRPNDTERSKVRRALVAVPFLVLSVVAALVMNPQPAVSSAKDIRNGGQVTWGAHTVPILVRFYHVKMLDTFVSLLNMFFAPAVYDDPSPSRRQAISFLGDSSVLLFVFWYESLRNSKGRWFLRIPMAFALTSQVVGMGIVCPIYLFTNYTFSNVHTAMSSPVSPAKSMGVLAGVLLGHLLPACGMFFWPTLPDRQAFMYIWQLYPAYLSLVFRAVSRISAWSMPRSGQSCPVGVRRLAFRLCIGLLTCITGGIWLWTVWTKGFGAVFVPKAMPSATLPDFAAFCREFLRWDELFTFSSAILWLAYWHKEAQSLRMTRVTLPVMGLCGALALVLAGPGTCLGVLWLMREEMLVVSQSPLK